MELALRMRCSENITIVLEMISPLQATMISAGLSEHSGPGCFLWILYKRLDVDPFDFEQRKYFGQFMEDACSIRFYIASSFSVIERMIGDESFIRVLLPISSGRSLIVKIVRCLKAGASISLKALMYKLIETRIRKSPNQVFFSITFEDPSEQRAMDNSRLKSVISKDFNKPFKLPDRMAPLAHSGDKDGDWNPLEYSSTWLPERSHNSSILFMLRNFLHGKKK